MRIKIGTKLIVGSALLVLIIATLGLYSANKGQESLKEAVGKGSVFLAEEVLNRIEQNIWLKVEELQKHSKHESLRKALSESNKEFERLDNLKRYLNQRQREWASVPKDEITPFMKRVINDELSNEIREEFIRFYEEVYGYRLFEFVLVTNKYGANIAQTGKHIEYRQDDKQWWQITKERGFYVGDVEYDEWAEIHGITIGVGITDKEGKFMGAMKALIGAEEIIREAEITSKKYATTRIKLLTRNGRLIYASKPYKFLEDVSEEDFYSKIGRGSDFFIAEEGGRERLFSYAHSKGCRNFEGHGWILAIYHDTGEVLKPALALRNNMMLASLVLIVLGIFVAFLMTRSITEPIAKLSRGTEIIGQGELDHRVEIKTKDEIGILADAFNSMVDNLREITASRDELNKEIKERKKAEEALEATNQQLRASEQQLRAANQQLDASNQQLKASEQQLRAANQQLDASNQQLRASEQELRKHRDHLEEVVEERTAELKEAQERFSGLYNSSKDAIGWSDPNGSLVDVNDAFCKLTGYSKEELVSRKKYQEFTPTEYHEWEANLVGNVLSTGEPAEYEKEYIRKDGTRVPVQLTVFVVRGPDDRYVGVAAIIKDITERKRAEKELQESEEKYRTLFDSSLDGIVFTDMEGHILDANKAYMRMLGYSEEEIKKLSYQQLTPKKWHEMEANIVKNQIEKRGYSDEYEKEYIRKDGTVFPVSIRVWLIKDEYGKPAGMWGIIRDITQFKEMQERLVHQEKLAVLGQLAGGVGHELRNPMTALKNAAYFLNMTLQQPEPKVKETLEILNKEVATSEKIISSLLDFTRPKAPDVQEVDVNEIVEEALSRATVPKNIEVVKELDHELPTILGDPDQLSQAFGNLILNAVQAMLKGGRLTVQSQVETPEQVAIHVGDTGAGIPQENLAKVFEPLFTTKARGIGLGLALTKTLVEGNGGTIEVKSEVGEGTTFTVGLPSAVGEAS